MNDKIILCVGGDSRQTFMSNALAEHYKVYTYLISSTGERCIALGNLEDMKEKADMLVLPIMSFTGLTVGEYNGRKLNCNELVSNLKKDAVVTGGRMSTEQIEYFSALGFDVADYFNREELVIKNCIPTAEGALQLAMQEMAVTIRDSRVLVIGYGRVGKACADLFNAVGAKVSVSARRLSQLAMAHNTGCDCFSTDELFGHISAFDLLINTVPSMILDEQQLMAVSKNSLIIDLASRPGGTDFAAAKKMNKRAIHALSLPGKVAPVTSGEIISQAVHNIYQERRMK